MFVCWQSTVYADHQRTWLSTPSYWYFHVNFLLKLMTHYTQSINWCSASLYPSFPFYNSTLKRLVFLSHSSKTTSFHWILRVASLFFTHNRSMIYCSLHVPIWAPVYWRKQGFITHLEMYEKRKKKLSLLWKLLELICYSKTWLFCSFTQIHL